MKINDSVYDEIELTGSLEEVAKTKPVQRLKNIHQGGAMFLAYPHIKTSRFEHSLGVCHLIKILGGNEREQIAGLLHDLPHTAFSHVIDYVLENNGEDFHEQHKLRFLLNQELSATLLSIGFKSEDFLEDEHFQILEAEHPALCADRIDYTLRDLIAWGKITQQEARLFVDSLVFVESEIAVKSVFWGQWFKDNYDYLNQHIFRDYKNVAANTMFSQLLKKALSINAIAVEDFFQDDNFVLSKINDRPVLQEDLKSLKIQLESDKVRSSTMEFKTRFVDPLIIESDRVSPLSKCIRA